MTAEGLVCSLVGGKLIGAGLVFALSCGKLLFEIFDRLIGCFGCLLGCGKLIDDHDKLFIAGNVPRGFVFRFES
jgi:hypothetical protein